MILSTVNDYISDLSGRVDRRRRVVQHHECPNDQLSMSGAIWKPLLSMLVCFLGGKVKNFTKITFLQRPVMI